MIQKKIHNIAHYYLFTVFFLFIALFSVSSCTKEQFTTNPADTLLFSTDTLSFDTVFTTIGSTSSGFIVYNKSPKKIRTSIKLAGANNSQFRINIDGVPTTQLNDVEIWGNDSLYVFVEVTVNPNDQNTPFVIADSVVFETNNRTQNVHLVAWGQNAHFFGVGTPNGTVVCDTTWTNDKPYIIYNRLIVDSLCTLTIEKGTRIYLHNGATMYVKGTLKINGDTDTANLVQLKGTRLENYYSPVPGQWNGIHFLRGSTNNTINGAIIKNATVAIRVDSLPQIADGTPNLVLTNTYISDIYDTGILGITGVIAAANCLIYNCGNYCTQLGYGGIYSFANCTFFNNNSTYIDHKNPNVLISNCLCLSDQIRYVAPINASFYNCIIYGATATVEEEVALYDETTSETTDFEVLFENCLLKTQRDTTIYKNCILNPNAQDTLFVAYRERNFKLNNESPCIHNGLNINILQLGNAQLDLSKDITGKTRTEPFDIGAYAY